MQHEYAQLPTLAIAVPDREEVLAEALLLQLRATRAAALILDIDIANGNSVKLLSEQVAKLVSVLATVEGMSRTNSNAVDDSAALSASFSFDDTNYQAVVVDASGEPLSSDSEVLP